jgi:hypothetical protein
MIRRCIAKMRDYISYQRWLTRKYNPHLKRAVVYRVNNEYHFATLHQSDTGAYLEDRHVELQPSDISNEEFIKCLKTALAASAAIRYATFQNNRAAFLKSHHAKSYKALYDHTVTMDVELDKTMSLAKVYLSKCIASQGRGLTPIADSSKVFEIHSMADWNGLREYLDSSFNI